MLFRCLTAAGLIALSPAAALALQAAQDAPIATQSAVNTPPAPTPESTANALRAAVFATPQPAGAPTPAMAPPTNPRASTPPVAPIAMLPATPTAETSAPVARPADPAVYGAVSTPTELAPGLPVKDRTGADIGQVTRIDTDDKTGQELVAIRMGDEGFRVAADRLGLWGGAARINLTQADIEAQLHPQK